MWLLIVIWLPFLLLLAGYLCSWPRRASWQGVFWFDGAVVLLVLATPACWFIRPEWFAADQADLLESRSWLPLIIPLVSTKRALIIVAIAAAARYFIFRRGTPTA